MFSILDCTRNNRFKSHDYMTIILYQKIYKFKMNDRTFSKDSRVTKHSALDLTVLGMIMSSLKSLRQF